MVKSGSSTGAPHAGDRKATKPKAKPYSLSRELPLQENMQELAKLVAAPPSRKTPISKADACYHLWTMAASDSEKRGDMLDIVLAGVLIKLINISHSDVTLKFNAVGCLQLLSTDEDGCRQIAKTKTHQPGRTGVAVIADLLHGAHDRTKVSAAAILYEMSTHYELMHDLIAVIPHMLRLIDNEEPEWSGIKKSHAYVATAIRNLLFDINPEHASQARRELFKHGGIPRLVVLLKRGPKEAATSAVACLRDLTPHPEMVDAIVQAEGIQNLIMLLEHGVEEQKALASACMCEMSTHDSCQDVMVACGALIPLVKCLSWGLETSSAANTDTPGRKGRRRRVSRAAKPGKRAPPLPPAIDMAVNNATATLHHLSFIDEVKVSIRECGAIPLLVSLLNAHSFIIQENVTGCLWNMALEPSNHGYLVSAQCPPHLLAPLHPNWLTPLDNPHTPYAGSNSLVAAKPMSAPQPKPRGSRGSERGSDSGARDTGQDGGGVGMGFRRGGGGALHPPRTPEETARAATPPRRRKPNVKPISFPKIHQTAE